MKIKVCFLVSSLCNEGPVNVMYNIIRYIDFTKFEVSIITLIPEKVSSRISDFEALPISIHQLASGKPLSPVTLYWSLRKKVEEIAPDILHAHCPRSLYLMCFLPRRYKRVYTIHIYPGLQQQILYGKAKGNIVVWLNNFFTKKCDLPIGCAESVGTLYKKEKGWEIFCIPNGCSLPIWQRNESEREKLRAEFGMRGDVKYFIFIGRFSQEKNPDVLVETFGMMKRKNVCLVMLGDGPMWSGLNDKKSDNIIMPGFTSRVYDYLKASDYYISASDVEGLANTILESMSVGLPMVLSDIPSHREVLASIKDRQFGCIIDNHNVVDILEKIKAVLKLDVDEIHKVLQDLYARKYTAEVMSNSYQKVYGRLMCAELH